jgi:serine/threonine-protein kinase HipA
MPGAKCNLEIFLGGSWTVAAEVRVDDVAGGLRSSARVEYDFDYLDAMGAALGARDRRAVSCRYPVGYQVHAEITWPAFLLDLIPSGAARRFWEAQLGLPNTPSSDWAILVAGGGNPPGNVRVAEVTSSSSPEAPSHPGFTREDVLARAEHFIEYAREQGASIAGGSGAAGDAPKFLLREDLDGRWHADGAIADERTARSWLVKFPRSPRAADRLVLEAEAPYYRLARHLGARTCGPLTWERDCLFVPRFDRIATTDHGIERLGLESLCSLAGVSEFGVSLPKERLAAALARFATDPARELRELVLRDVLDVALGNTDNHARNTAVSKYPDGTVELSPLYDFAPMVLDPQGIARVCRWQAERGGFPDWSGVAEAVGQHGADVPRLKDLLRDLAEPVRALPTVMRTEGVPASVIEALDERIGRVAASLAEVR